MNVYTEIQKKLDDKKTTKIQRKKLTELFGLLCIEAYKQFGQKVLDKS